MIFDINVYRIHFKDLKAALEPRPKEVRNYWASFFAATSQCPIIAVLYFTAEIYGMDKETRDNLDIVEKLNSVTKVIGYKNEN